MSAKKKILIVDDENTMVSILKKRIESEAFEVLVARDGQEGLDTARREKPDLIVVDVMMPKLDGYHMCRLLKFDEKYKDIPVIMLTSRIRQEDRDIANDVGASAYITKPFKGQELMGKIKDLLASEEETLK